MAKQAPSSRARVKEGEISSTRKNSQPHGLNIEPWSGLSEKVPCPEPTFRGVVWERMQQEAHSDRVTGVNGAFPFLSFHPKGYVH